MTEEVKIDIQISGFPVKLGAIELWFDSSLENLRKFFNVEEIAQEKLKEAQEKAQALNFPDKVNVETLDIDTVNAAFDVNKTYIGAQYDIIFGDGTFDKLYKVYPDIMALEQTLNIVGVAIGDKIVTMEADRATKTELKKSEYLAKKTKKVGK